MKILIHENVLTIKTLENKIEDILRTLTYTLEPDPGKMLRDKRTGFTTDSIIGVSSKEEIDNYEEIDKE